MRRLASVALVAVAAFVGAGSPALATTTPQRVEGYPTSSNGASSLHLGWTTGVTAPKVSAVLEVVEPPTTSALYFWALQVDFVDGTTVIGSAHLGLQWDPSRSSRTTANFGGLVGAREVGRTRSFRWEPGRRYELRISSEGAGWWKGEITDLGSGTVTLVDRLQAGGRSLARPYVWSEVFARCDAPSTAVRWSQLEPATPSVRVTYQSHLSGGCSNTTAESTSRGIVQRTNTVRVVDALAVLRT